MYVCMWCALLCVLTCVVHLCVFVCLSINTVVLLRPSLLLLILQGRGVLHPHAMISLAPATKDELLLCYDSELNSYIVPALL